MLRRRRRVEGALLRFLDPASERPRPVTLALSFADNYEVRGVVDQPRFATGMGACTRLVSDPVVVCKPPPPPPRRRGRPLSGRLIDRTFWASELSVCVF
jgi:hypothetical protein